MGHFEEDISPEHHIGFGGGHVEETYVNKSRFFISTVEQIEKFENEIVIRRIHDDWIVVAWDVKLKKKDFLTLNFYNERGIV